MGIINLAPKVLDPIPGGKYVVNAIDYVVNWARANSIWPLTYGTSCCASHASGLPVIPGRS